VIGIIGLRRDTFSDLRTSAESSLYFVVETKSSLFKDDLRDKEGGKIKCGEAHFEALAVGDNPARYKVATKLDDIL
jgi:type III restriction enzyme